MKRLFALLLLIVPLMLQAREAFYVESADITVEVKRDGRLEVTELLNLFYEEPCHGFIKTIPTVVWTNRDVSEAQDGSRKKMMRSTDELKDVTVSTTYRLEEHSEYADIRIGSASDWVEGPQQYKLTYTLQQEEDRVPTADIFYLSLWGTSWDCEVKELSFRVNFEEAIPEASIEKLELFVGPEGDHRLQNDKYLTEVNARTVAGHVTGMKAHHAATLLVPLPEGYYLVEPSKWINISWGWAVATLLLLSLAYYYMIHTEKVTPVVTFKPKAGIDSAVVGTLIDGKVDDIDLLSLIPKFAADGYLSISQSKTGTTELTKLKNMPTSAPSHQQSLFMAFWRHGGDKFNFRVTPSKDFAAGWYAAKEKLKEHTKDMANEYATQGVVAMMAATFTCSFTVCCALTDNWGWPAAICLWLTFMLFLFIGMGYKDLYYLVYDLLTAEIVEVIIAVIILGGVLYLPYSLFWLDYRLMFYECNYYIPEVAVWGLIALTAIPCLLVTHITKMSKKRKELLGEILGLREFVETAERSRLEALLAEDEQYFYKVLPFAMAFGMVDKWAEKFSNLPMKFCPNIQVDNTSTLSGMMQKKALLDNNTRGIIRKYAASQSTKTSGSGSGYSSHSSHSSASSHGSHRSSGGYSGGGHGGGGGRSW